MKKFRFVILTLLIHSGVSKADLPVVLTKDTKTFVNLMDTDLVKKKDMLDCQLRLEGKPPHYKLVYSLGEIDVPTLAVKEMYDRTFVTLSVRALVSGLPVTELFIPYNGKVGEMYKPIGSVGFVDGIVFENTGHYDITVSQPEARVLQALRARYAKDQVVGHKEWPSGLEPGAVMLRSHPEPKLFLAAMDGLSGAKNKAHTMLYYICLADR